jgi:hypothetical protein
VRGIATTKLCRYGGHRYVHQPTLSLEQQVLIFFECVFAIVTTNLYCYGGGHHVHRPTLSPEQQIVIFFECVFAITWSYYSFSHASHRRLKLLLLFTLVLSTPTTSYLLLWSSFSGIGLSILLVSSSSCGVVAPSC